MSSDFRGFRLGGMTVGAALVAGLLTTASPGVAQPQPAATTPAPATSELTVVAPRVVRRASTGASAFAGAPVEVLSASRVVGFGDLDLRTRDGVDEFKRRIMYGALAACDQIEAEYPSNIYVPVSATSCPDTTARAALVVADEVIAASRGHRR